MVTEQLPVEMKLFFESGNEQKTSWGEPSFVEFPWKVCVCGSYLVGERSVCDGMSQVFFTRVLLLLWKTCGTEKVLFFQISAVYGPMRLFETTNAHLIPVPKKIEGLLMSLKVY